MRRTLLLLVALHASACAGSGARSFRPVAPHGGPSMARLDVTDAQCVGWLGARRTWGAVGIGSAALASGGGLTSLLQGSSDDRTAGVIGGVSALLFGALGLVSTALSRSYAEDFGQHCSDAERPAR